MESDESFQEAQRHAARARRHFQRRGKAVLAGLHLPTERELLAGMPFLGEDIQQDMQAFAERLMPRLRRKADHAHFAAVIHHLEQLTVSAGADEVRALAVVLAEAASTLPSRAWSWRLRCRIYLAHLGDQRAALDLARDAVGVAISLDRDMDQWGTAVGMIQAALGWISFAISDPEFDFLGAEAYPPRSGRPGPMAANLGLRLIGLVEHQASLARSESPQDASAKVQQPATARPVSAATPQEVAGASLPSAVVFHQVGNANTGEGKKVAKELEELTGKALPLVPIPDLAVARADLRAQFPYAADIIDSILLDIPVRPHVQLRPTILVGSPGCGKSRFAHRLLTALAIPHDVIPCGGLSDGAFAGTGRRWSTGEPSLPAALITRHRIAGPGAVLDEIEKVGTSRHNGQVHDALLAFLERETASRFHDPYVQAPCDLSHVTWLMTANSLEGLSAPLRDRCRVIPFPEPGLEHLPALSRQIIADLLAEQGLDHRWASPLDAVEMEAIARAWPGGSLRKLRRMIEAALAARSVKH
jgi:hypothetical protein